MLLLSLFAALSVSAINAQFTSQGSIRSDPSQFGIGGNSGNAINTQQQASVPIVSSEQDPTTLNTGYGTPYGAVGSTPVYVAPANGGVIGGQGGYGVQGYGGQGAYPSLTSQGTLQSSPTQVGLGGPNSGNVINNQAQTSQPSLTTVQSPTFANVQPAYGVQNQPQGTIVPSQQYGGQIVPQYTGVITPTQGAYPQGINGYTSGVGSIGNPTIGPDEVQGSTNGKQVDANKVVTNVGSPPGILGGLGSAL